MAENKIHFDLSMIINVLIALIIFKILDVLFLDEAVDKMAKSFESKEE